MTELVPARRACPAPEPKASGTGPHRLTVRTAGFQSANRSSILRGATSSLLMVGHSSIKGKREISSLPKAFTFREFEKKKREKFEKEKKKEIEIKDVNGKGKHYFLREDWEFIEQSDMKDLKAFIIERWKQVRVKKPLAYPKTGTIGKMEYRISYYIVTTKNRWWFGQYATLIPEEDIQEIQKAITRMEKRAHTP